MAAGGWKPTPIGLQYFKHNRHEFRVEYPVKAARPIGNKFVGQQKRWQFDREYNENPDTEKYMAADDKEVITVAQTKVNMMMANDREKENHARDAAQKYIERQPTIIVRDPNTGEEGEYHIVSYDSPIDFVWDPTRPIRITLLRKNVYDRSNPSADDILERPLQNFFVVPDDCYRPWDLHPESLVKTGRCAVTMIHECYTKRARKGRATTRHDGKLKYAWGYNYALTEDQIEAELDTIFTELGYVSGEYPFEVGWRGDGVTSKMVLAFAMKHEVI